MLVYMLCLVCSENLSEKEMLGVTSFLAWLGPNQGSLMLCLICFIVLGFCWLWIWWISFFDIGTLCSQWRDVLFILPFRLWILFAKSWASRLFYHS